MTIIRTTYKGNDISLTEEDYEQILRRFDPANFVWRTNMPEGSAGFINNTSCPLCDKCSRHLIGPDCSLCTFGSFNTETTNGYIDKHTRGCMKFLNDAVGSCRHFIVSTDSVYYRRDHQEAVVEELNKLIEFLKGWR